tara:strand:+ start:373 stop:1020 length:648 start_codon:yes stop_codon:yes gene_type:complete
MYFITSIGRSGTTFLVVLYTLLGFKTGFTKEDFENYVGSFSSAGLENTFEEIESKKLEVAKNPYYMLDIGLVAKKFHIDYVLFPLRDYEESANSRLNIHKSTINTLGFLKERNAAVSGGLWNATNASEQLQFYYKVVAKFVLDSTKFSVPVIYIDFVRMINEPKYLYKTLLPTFKNKNISLELFVEKYKEATNIQIDWNKRRKKSCKSSVLSMEK